MLKVLEVVGEGSSARLARFIQEYALLSRVDHPHVIRIHDQGFSDDHAFIAMEYFERGDAITPASDLYSLGVMFHEMLTGSRPFSGETLDLLLALHINGAPPRLPPDLAALQPMLDRLLAKSPQDRYASARELLDDLGRPELLRTFSA